MFYLIGCCGLLCHHCSRGIGIRYGPMILTRVSLSLKID